MLALASAVPLVYHLARELPRISCPHDRFLGALHSAVGRPSPEIFALALVLLVLSAFVVRHVFGVFSARFQQRFVYASP